MRPEPTPIHEARSALSREEGEAPFSPRIEEGDWLYASWGYEQTNATFWLVTRRTAQTVWFKPYRHQPFNEKLGAPHIGVKPNIEDPDLRHMWERCDGREWHRHFDGRVAPPCLVHVELKRKVQDAGTEKERVWVERSYMLAGKWDGSPAYDTIAAGHPGH